MVESSMRRRVLIVLTLAGALVALFGAALLPVHLRALNPRVLERGAARGKSFLNVTEELSARNPAAAKILLRAAENMDLPGTEDVLDVLRNIAEARPAAINPLQQMERAAAGRVEVQETPVLNALRAREDRERLAGSFRSQDAQRILQNRNLTNLTLFAPVHSGAGYPFDTAILATAFLMEQGAFGANTRAESNAKEQILQLSARGISTNQVAALEDFYLDMFALAKRFSSEQLSAFVGNLQNYNALDRLARFLQDRPGTMPVIYSAVVISRDGDRVAQYLTKFPETGVEDLRLALGLGARAVMEVVSAQQPVYRAALHNRLLASPGLSFMTNPFVGFAVQFPVLALLTKWFFLLLAGLALAYFFRALREPAEEQEPIYWVPQLGFARRVGFAVVFLALTVLLGEPYLAQGQAEEKPATRVSFPIFGAATPPAASVKNNSNRFMINPSTLIAMGVFLVLQGSIYFFCLTKLAEIRRQDLSSPMKLRLLENEENLFDAGLYLGLFGTAASLILLTLGLIKPSLVSAYSSTLFGILFVALLKIFHVRPYKRRLIIESDPEGQPA
jgi:hypothetical protein